MTETGISEKELIGKIIDGDHAFFELVIRRSNPGLYKVARSFGFNHADAQDLMQDAYVQAFLKLKDFDGRAALKTWITKILVNKCIYRKSYGYTKHETPGTDIINESSTPMQLSNPNSTTDRIINNREFSRLLETTLNEIPEHYRTVFVLREIEGFNVVDTAEMLDITPVNVKVRLNRAKTMLQQKLEKYYSGSDIYEFNLIYCDAMVASVFEKLSSANYV